MTFDKLVDFITNQMRMSHIYQPLLIRTLIDADGKATVRQIAQSFLLRDEGQLGYYESRIKAMPVKVLKKHGVIESDGDLVKLAMKKLSLQEKATLRALCEQKMQEYIRKRGMAIWDYRLGETDPVPDSLYYQVLKESGGRCALCGATKKERPLHVDHIKPRSRGGKNELANLQVLCIACNLAKSNKDDTDFRSNLEAEQDPSCPFCNIAESRIVESNSSALAIRDKFPVTKGHLLVLPIRHVSDFFGMTNKERRDTDDLARLLRNRAMASDPTIAGFNVGANCGEVAGQTVMHSHIHLIPRRRGDTPAPRGGVRGVVPDKMSY